MRGYVKDAIKSTQEDRHLAVNLDNVKWELANADKELKWLRSAVSSSEKENDQIRRKMDEVKMELDNERFSSLFRFNFSPLVLVCLGTCAYFAMTSGTLGHLFCGCG